MKNEKMLKNRQKKVEFKVLNENLAMGNVHWTSIGFQNLFILIERILTELTVKITNKINFILVF